MSATVSCWDFRRILRAGQVIPALPLALTRTRRWDERSQRALVRYYLDAGAGGLAVGVHSTQFAIRHPKIGLYRPVLSLAAEVARNWPARSMHKPAKPVLIAGICGLTAQAVGEAETARDLGYHAGLLNLGAWKGVANKAVLRHCCRIAEVLPLIGFYLQESAGGRPLNCHFWREFVEIPEVAAIKIAPFNRYRTLDVIRAVIEAGRDDIALYTGNDDNIIGDLLAKFTVNGKSRHLDGGLLGQWGVWTQRAVWMLRALQREREKPRISAVWLERNAELTDANAALFDAAHGFAGCLPGVHEILRRNGLMQTVMTLDPVEKLSRGQAAELTRVAQAYPWLVDDAFVAANLDDWRR